MARIALCFSGHPRNFLNHREAWDAWFGQLRQEHTLSVFFHSWSTGGNVLRDASGRFSEGSYDAAAFGRFDELLDALTPSAFAIETHAEELERRISEMPPAILTSVQAGKRAILSQIYSVGRADLLRRTHEARHGASDVVIKLRFDLKPTEPSDYEIDYITANPAVPVIFAPSPHFHVHPGGGAGCRACQAFFEHNRAQPDFAIRLTDFLSTHGYHGNDICDLYAIASPASMRDYVGALDDSAVIYERIKAIHRLVDVHPMGVQPDHDDERDLRIVGGGVGFRGLEQTPFFYPEKLLRFGLGLQLVVDGHSRFVIERS